MTETYEGIKFSLMQTKTSSLWIVKKKPNDRASTHELLFVKKPNHNHIKHEKYGHRSEVDQLRRRTKQ